jgi:hypothetical protein
MTDYALTSLTPAAPQIAPHAGLLYAPGTDWANWAMLILCAVALWCLMPGQLKASLAQLWAPMGCFLRSLRAPLAVGWWGWMVLCVLRPMWAVLWFLEDVDEQAFPRWGSAGFKGFMVPIVR